MDSSRRRFVAAAGIAGVGAAGLAASHFWPELGLLNPCLGALPLELARHRLVVDAWVGLNPVQTWDSHAHLFGIGEHGNIGSASFNDARGTLRWPLVTAQAYFFRNAAYVAGAIDIDWANRGALRCDGREPGPRSKPAGWAGAMGREFQPVRATHG